MMLVSLFGFRALSFKQANASAPGCKKKTRVTVCKEMKGGGGCNA
jgi:hypothetical protein